MSIVMRRSVVEIYRLVGLKIEAIRISERSINFYQITLRCIPEESYRNTIRCLNMKSDSLFCHV
jgi:hypothetical protein